MERAGLFAVAFLACAAVPCTPFPETPVETLSGTRLDVSRDIAPNLAVFIVGFTKASRAQTSEWSRQLDPELARISAVQVYEVAVLADVPKILRGFVIGQIRADVPKTMHSHFLLVLDRADAWKRLANYGKKDAAYVMLVRHGELLWRGEGGFTEANRQKLILALRALLGIEPG